MSENNPEVLIPSLSELIDHLNKWNYYASESIRESGDLLSVANDCTDDSKVSVTLSENQVMDDSLKVENEKNDISILRSKCDIEKSVTSQLLNSSRSSLDQAFSTLNYWEEELRKAHEWVRKATKRLEDAKLNYDAALINLEEAKNELEATKAQLDDCLSEGKRPCLLELAVVAVAKIRHINALMKRKIAKVELREATKELEIAGLCLNNCEDAHRLSLELVPSAQSTYNSAIETDEMMNRSLADIAGAESIIQKTEVTSKNQKECLNESRVLLNNQIALNNEAEIIHYDNYNLINSSQDLTIGTIHDLESRIESLTRFAQPSGIDKSGINGSAPNTPYKNPGTIAGSILATSLILGHEASDLTARTYMSILAEGKSKTGKKKLPAINESGIFNKTGPEIQQFPLKSLENKLNDEERFYPDHSESYKLAGENSIKKLPLFNPSEQKYLMEKQSLNNHSYYKLPSINLYYANSEGITHAKRNDYLFNNKSAFKYEIKPMYYSSPYFSSFGEKVKNTAKEIIVNRSSFEKYYDPIGTAIDEATKKEFPGCAGIIGLDHKAHIKKEMEFEQYQHPSYLTQSIQASMNNDYSSIKPLY